MRRMKRLTVGQKVPDFTVTDIDGGIVSPGGMTEGYVLFAFLRYAGCPWCNLAVHRLAMESKMLEQNDCRIVVFVQSSKDKVLENIQEKHAHKPEFPVVADPHKRIFKLFGVNRSLHSVVRAINDIPAWLHSVKELNFPQGKIDGDLFLAQALFLVPCKTGTIVQALHDKSLYYHETFTPIYQSLIFKET